MEQRFAQQGSTAAQHEAGDGGAEQAVAHDAVQVVVPAGAMFWLVKVTAAWAKAFMAV